MPKVSSSAALEEFRKGILSKRQDKTCISICGGTGCLSHGNGEIIRAFEKEVKKQSLTAKVDVRETGCPGLCEVGPAVIIYPEEICYVGVTAKDVAEIVSETAVAKKVIDRLVYTDPNTGAKAVHLSEIPFYKSQMRLVIGDNGRINPKNIDDYLAVGGYSAFVKSLSMSGQQIVDEIKKSGLRGRSGGGFPAGLKLEACLKAEGDKKYVICNCHEGDPGAFVDRRMMEANPHNIIEGMLIGAYAIGASEGFIFVGDEFPLTLENTQAAIDQAEEHGLLGSNILGSGFNFTLKINIDGGDYVCGETTSLTACLEGRIGEPIAKYDHATESGLWGKPTDLNNLQTFANIPVIINKGGDWYGNIGTKSSKGTRVFSLMGNIRNNGMVEVPMGMTLKEVIFDIGGGVPDDKKFKAVLVGGPMGGFVPESGLSMPVDFDEMKKAGLNLGPGLIVLDENVCIVDMVKYYLTFLAEESCGKCTPCREGLRQMLRILTNITEGHGKKSDFDVLERIAAAQKPSALCALGQGASNTLTSSLKHFRAEYEAHIDGNRCPAGVCKTLSTASLRTGA